MHTTAYWLTVPPAVMQALPYSKDDKRDGVVGLGFAMKSIAALLLMCDGRDLGLAFGQGDEAQGETRPTGGRTALPEQLGDEPRIYLYDAFPGGIGFSAPLHGMHHDLLDRTRELIAGCDCDHGCPTCVGPIGETGRAPRRWRWRCWRAGLARGPARRRAARWPRARAGAPDGRAVLTMLKPSLADRLRAVVGTVPPAVPRVQPGEGETTPRSRALGRPRPARRRGAGGAVHEAAGGRCIVVERHYGPDDRHGRHAVANIVRTLQAAAEGFTALGRAWPGTRGVAPSAGPLLQDLDGLCVVDLETTGLAGGAGTQAFLVGCARLEGEGVTIRQFLSPGFEHERAQLHLVSEWMRDRTQLVTFNGRTFDVPLLEMRFSYHRLPWPWGTLPHLDACIRPGASGAIGPRWRGPTPTRRAARWGCSSGG